MMHAPKTPENTEQILSNSLEVILDRISLIEGENAKRCQSFIEDSLELLKQAPGSRHNHQAWKGGYLDHLADTFELADYLLQFKSERRRPFTAADIYLVMFLHDIEKPFAYTFDGDGRIVTRPELADKPAKKQLREELIEKYEFDLSKSHQNALRYVEGIPSNEYTPGGRLMNELAGFCHVLDSFSARVDHGYPEH